jgi:type II secretory ATPase GspE/PulE/Tfp pilus assembly ATPase PilB-like protein
LEASDKRIVDEILAKPHGVILVTGPTGSGKTTTLYSFLASLNSMERKIITIEDPIEYKLEGITQIQVRPRIGLDFARGLRSMLRHDPDVMMVGEIRDQETAETVIRVALTGHLVFSTVHTNDAPSTPARLMDMSVEPYLVASSVECVIAQRLVRLVCNDCAEAMVPALDPVSLGVSEMGLERIMRRSQDRFRIGRGCASCRMTGYRGRTAIFETMPMTPSIRELIQHKESAAKIAAQARREECWPLRWKGLVLASTGRTSIEEVLRVTAADDIY